MKKFMQIITAVILSVTFVGATAGAQSVPTGTISCDDITIVNTGSNNENNVTCTTVTQTTITCTNNVVVGNVSFQDGQSGTATGTGTVKSGTIVNYNNTQTAIGASCGTTSTTTSPSPSPSMSPTPTTKAASLPNTASNDTASIIAVSLAVAAGIVAFSRIAVTAYRHIGNK